MKPRTLVGFGVLACIPCCIGPILAALGAVAAFGVASTLVIGGAGLAIAAAAIAGTVIVRRRSRLSGNRSTIEPVAVELTPSRSPTR